MKNLLLAIGLAAAFLGAGAAPADAQMSPSYEVGYSSWVAVGVRCTTGTVVQINASRPTGFTQRVAGYLIQNQDSSNSVWVGGPSVSTSTVTGDSIANLGAKITSIGNWPLMVGKIAAQPNSTVNTNAEVPVYCKAADAAGAPGVVLHLSWFGY